MIKAFTAGGWRWATLAASGWLAVIAPAHAESDGESLYRRYCALCHDAAVAGAPKLTDKANWTPRLARGDAALAASVIQGKGVMPPRAGTSLSDDQIRAAVDFMVAKAR